MTELVLDLDEETRARWQLAADRLGWTVEEWLRDVASTASDPDAGDVVSPQPPVPEQERNSE